VEIDLRYAALGAVVGRPVVKLRTCSRWPQRARCGAPCLDQLEAAPEDHLVRNILARWYVSRRCASCRAPFEPMRWHDYAPALLGPDQTLREWDELAAADLAAVLATHRPVCWNCATVARLHRDRPDLFQIRPPRAGTRAV
jgi:hypothetical protein